ncbi:MAG: hypothetical protein V3V18_08455 [Methylococcales bacterium]
MAIHYAYTMTRKNTPNGGFAGSIGSVAIEGGGEQKIREEGRSIAMLFYRHRFQLNIGNDVT